MSVKSVFQSPLPQQLSGGPSTAWNTFTCLIGSNFLHDKLAPIVNPAVAKDPVKSAELDLLRAKLFAPDGEFKAELVNFKSADGADIEGALFAGTSKKAILFGLGSGGRYEAVADPNDAAHDFVKFFRTQLNEGMNVLVINTRGIEHSTHTPSLEGSALDYYSAWNFLESKGLQVLPWGHSLGFRYVVPAAAWKQYENPDKNIGCVSDRSFDDIATEGKEIMGGGVLGTVAGLFLRYSGWGGAAQDPWNSLKGRGLILVAPEDTTVPYSTASFYKKTKANPSHTEFTVIKLRGKNNPHKRIYNEEEGRAISAVVTKMFE